MLRRLLLSRLEALSQKLSRPSIVPLHAEMSTYFFEDYSPGRVWEWGEYVVTREEIISFASQYDPQPFHLDEEVAARSVFGGLTAAGVHTIAIWNKMFHLDHGPRFRALALLAISEITLPNPVRPGDILRVSYECTSIRESKSRHDRGITVTESSLVNQESDVCMTCTSSILVPKRSAAFDDVVKPSVTEARDE